MHLNHCNFVCMKGQSSSWPCASEIQLPFYWVNKTINVVNSPRIIHSFLNLLTALGLMTLSGNKLTLQIINCYWEIFAYDFKAANNASQVWKENTWSKLAAPWFLFFFFLYCHTAGDFFWCARLSTGVLGSLRLGKEPACMTHTISWSRPH